MTILEFYELHAITGDVQKVYSAATNEEQEMGTNTNFDITSGTKYLFGGIDFFGEIEKRLKALESSKTEQAAYSAATNEEQEMKQPIPHKHAAMIKEWADDPRRVVEYQLKDSVWYEFTDSLYDEIELFDEDYEWRFSDQVTPVKPEIVSSLSDEEINRCMIGDDYWPQSNGWRSIANAAAKRAMEDYKREQELKQCSRYFKSEDIVSSLRNEEMLGILGWTTGYDITKDVRRLADKVAKLAYAEGYQAAIDAVCALPSQTSLVFQFNMDGIARKAASNKAIAQFQADVKKLLGGV